MKHLKTVFNALMGLSLMIFSGAATPVYAQEATVSKAVVEAISADPMDSVEISLLTCQPHDEVYSLYGHTAIRYHDLRNGGIDVAFNYGVFNFNAPHFVLRFVFGLTDYELGVYPYHIFQKEYAHFGSMVIEQVLNLTNEEKWKIHHALEENLRPENKVYRYNFFYNNCTTKARDVVERSINGKVEYAEREDFAPTFRTIVHDQMHQHPWTRFGIDLLLGIKADRQTTQQEQEFLPNNLMYDFDHAQIYVNGEYRPLVRERRISVPAGIQMVQEGFPFSPLSCSLVLLLFGIVLTIIQARTKRTFRLWSIILMLVAGAIGIVLFLMLFSQHPTVSLNLQFIFFNPIHWVFLWSVLRKKPTRYWYTVPVLALLFLIGGLFQHYAEGIYVLALCLLLQSILHISRMRRK